MRFAAPSIGVPQVLIPGASTVSVFHRGLQVDLLFLDDIIPLHVMDVYPKFPLLVLVRSGNPQGVRDAFRSAWNGVSGRT